MALKSCLWFLVAVAVVVNTTSGIYFYLNLKIIRLRQWKRMHFKIFFYACNCRHFVVIVLRGCIYDTYTYNIYREDRCLTRDIVKKKCYKNILMICDSILSPCQGSEIENTQLVEGEIIYHCKLREV